MLSRALAGALFLCLALLEPCTLGAERFARFRDLRVDGPSSALSDATIELGRIKVTLAEGEAHRVLSSDGELAGYVLLGEGAFSFRRQGLDDVALRQNLKAARSTLKVELGVVRDSFEKALILFARPDPSLLNTDSPTEAGAEEARALLAEVKADLAREHFPFDHVAEFARTNGGADQLVYMEFFGRRARTGYEYDLARSFAESLFHFSTIPGYEYRFRDSILRAPIPGYEGGGPATCSLDHGDFSVELANDREALFSSDLRFVSHREGLRILNLSLANNRDRGSTSWNSDKRAHRVTSIKDETGSDLSYSHRYHEIAIDLGRTLSRGESFSLHVESGGEILVSRASKGGDKYRDLAFVDWFPVPFTTGERRYTFDIEIKSPKPYRPVVSGDTTRYEETESHFIVASSQRKRVKDLALFLGRYTVLEKEFENFKIRVHGYGRAREKDLEALANVATMFADILAGMLGPLPHDELELVELPYSFFDMGISRPGVIFLTSGSFRSGSPEDAYWKRRGTNALIAHEVAHQWFGSEVWPNSYMRDNWISESFAEYCAALAMSAAYKRVESEGRRVGKALLSFPQLHNYWLGDARMARGHGTVLGANELAGTNGYFYRIQLLYSRGPLVLHMFRTLVGDQRFFETLRRFIAEADHGPARTEDFVSAANRVTGMDWTWFFDQWLSKPHMPELHVEESIGTHQGQPALIGTLDQDPAEFMKVHVPFILTYPGGKRGVKLVFQETPHFEFALPLPARPARVDVDPARNNLVIYD